MRALALVRLVALFTAALLTFVAVPGSSLAQPKKDVVREKLMELQMATYKAQGTNFFAGRKKAERWLAYARKHRGDTHPDTLMAMQSLASMYGLTGAQRKAEKLYLEIVSTTEATEGSESLKTAMALDALASNYWGQQRMDEAEKLFTRTLKIYLKLYGETDMFANMLGRQAAFMMSRYMFAAAEQLYYDQLRIFRKSDPDGDQAISVQLSLGMLYGRQGEIKKAKKAFDKLIAAYEKKYGKDDTTRLPSTVQSIAMMYEIWGKPSWAKGLYESNVKAFRRQLDKLRADPKTHPAMISAIEHQLANVLKRQGKLDEAAAIFEKMLASQEKLYGKNSFQASTALYPLAEIYRDKGETKKARAVLKKWVKSYKSAFGGFSAITPLIFLGDLERVTGNFKEARRLAVKVHQAAAKTYGKRHPLTMRYAESVALADLGLKKPKKALELLRAAYAVEKKAIALVMASGTENDNRTYLNERRHHLHMAVTLHSQYLPSNKDAIRLGLDTVLVHKGRLLDASAASVGSLRQQLSTKDQKLLDELAAARAELSQLVIAGPKATDDDEAAYGKEIARLERLVRKLEAKVRSRSAVFRAREQPIEISAIQKAIPRQASLVEVVTYRRIDPAARQYLPSGGDRYGAYVLGTSGEPSFVDLGSAKRIDDVVGKLRQELARPSSDNYERYGKQLHNLVFAKIEPLLGNRRAVLMAPDGALNLVPFAALVDGRGKFLVERFQFSYLSSGRDLLRLAVKINAKGGPIIFADPSFDDSGKASSKSKSRGLTARALRSVKWKKLPGTAKEAKAIVKLIDGFELFDGKMATEATLKKVVAPRILHLATHGFFLPGETKVAPEQPTTNSAIVLPSAAQGVGSGQDNPLLRSGIALAGANKLASGNEDGVLTALEASGLNLWGTKLVVMSACETGVGEIAQGEGVYGLRRALVMAGAESMLMSLWQVDDDATKDLMIGYYERIKKGKGRAQALRLVQLKMLESDKHQHPYFWASFIPSGSWEPMKMK